MKQFTYTYRRLIIELSICDICIMPIAILINFLFLFSFFFFLLFLCFSFFSLFKFSVSCNRFLKKIFLNERKIKLILFSDFILHSFKKFKFYHSTKGHAFLFWPCYIRYALLSEICCPVSVPGGL